METDITLPGLAAAGIDLAPRREITLTIVFHSDLDRIGQRSVLPRSGLERWVLGRGFPLFAVGGEGEPLADPYLSRVALQAQREGQALRLVRPEGASRCRVDGVDVEDGVLLSLERLEAGVSIQLAHSVVLLLRLAPAAVSCEQHVAFDPLVGSSPAMAALRTQLLRAATAEVDVLLTGESGTGKELAAIAIHRASARAGAPLVSVNMAAIPADLAAAALFGNRRGAFTGAERASEGYFREAEGGTLFLDEIGAAPVELQPLLLRALQQREVQSVGGGLHRVDLRVVSATDAPLEGEGCRFSTALRHRLGACEIELPPLRARPEDIGELLRHFLLEGAGPGNQLLLPSPGGDALRVAAWAGLFHDCLRYDWPGNVRELVNLAGQLVLAGGELDIQPRVLRRLRHSTITRVPESPALTTPDLRPMHQVSEGEFIQAMQSCAFEVARVARQLQVSRQAVYRRIEQSDRFRLASAVSREEIEAALGECRGDTARTALRLQISLPGLLARLRQDGPRPPPGTP